LLLSNMNSLAAVRKKSFVRIKRNDHADLSIIVLSLYADHNIEVIKDMMSEMGSNYCLKTILWIKDVN